MNHGSDNKSTKSNNQLNQRFRQLIGEIKQQSVKSHLFLHYLFEIVSLVD